MCYLKMESWVKPMINITINKYEYYKIKLCKIFIVNIDVCNHNKQR